MSRRKKQQRNRRSQVVSETSADTADAVPEEVLAEGSGPHDDAPSADDLAAAAEHAMAAEPAEAGESVAEAEAIEAAADADAEPVMEDEGALEAAPSEAVDGEADDPDAVGDVAAVLPTSAASLDDVGLKHLVEAIVFASDKPVTIQRLRQLTRISDVRRIEQALEQLAIDFGSRGIALQHISGGYQFRTNTAYSPWVQQLIAGRPVRLSRAQLETLAIVAYRQPITRPEIDEIRGVDSSATLRLLLDRSLIRVLGKREEVGRPMLYGTTGEFLDFFSLQDLRELPTLREYSELTAESRQVMSDRLGVPIEAESPPPAAVEAAPPVEAVDPSAVEASIEAPAESPVESVESVESPVVASDVEGEVVFAADDIEPDIAHAHSDHESEPSTFDDDELD